VSDLDMRWIVLEEILDERTAEERDPEHESYIPKKRFSPISHYLSDHEFVKDAHFDIKEPKIP
jgi:hypothetical protein